MHMQAGTPGWLNALAIMPPRVLVKAVNDPSICREAKQVKPDCYTCVRHADVDRAPSGFDYAQAKAWWRVQFFKFVDRTYLEQYAPYVNMVEEANEYTASSTWLNPAETETALNSARAAVAVWNGEFRGKQVRAPDGGIGLIPADCRLVLCNGPVSNTIHREYFRLAVEDDCIVGYHPYTRYFRGTRFENDWRDDSGRWHFMEQEYGLKPLHAGTECGPYINTENGWRHPDVLDGNVPALIQAFRNWLEDVRETPAYREGRLLGPGAWFTSGNVGWPYYQLETPELLLLAELMRELWNPGETDMDAITKEKIRQHAQAILDLVADDWWKTKNPPYKLPPQNKLVQFLQVNGEPFMPNQVRHVTYAMDVFERSGDLLRVTAAPPAGSYLPRENWWVDAKTITPP